MALRLSGGRLAAVSVSAFGAQMRVRNRYPALLWAGGSVRPGGSAGKWHIVVAVEPGWGEERGAVHFCRGAADFGCVQPAASMDSGRRTTAVDSDSLADGSIFGGQGMPDGNGGAAPGLAAWG